MYGVGATIMVQPFLTSFPLLLVNPTTPSSKSYNTSVLKEYSYSYHTCARSPKPFLYVNHRSLTLVCGEEVRQKSVDISL
jgi:hypothetical protein